MIIKYGDDLWNSIDDVILVTSNSYINYKDEVVMGRGAALEMKNKYPKTPYQFGRMIKYYVRHLGKYGVIVLNLYATADEILFRQSGWVGLFQVKYHFKDKADLDLISYSTDKLLNMLDRELFRKTISMNFPGIGYGGRKLDEVYEIVKILPDNITMYIKD